MGLNGVPQKDANPLIKGLENLEIQAKASDFDEFSSKSAIIFGLTAVCCCFGLLPTDVAINVSRPVLIFENMGFEAHFFLPFLFEGWL